MNERSTGHIEAIVGCMFSGKSEELIRRLRRAVIGRQRVQVFKPAADTRSEGVLSRDNRTLDAVAVASSHEMRQHLRWGTQVVGIDEAQFFDDRIDRLVVEMANAGIRVITSTNCTPSACAAGLRRSSVSASPAARNKSSSATTTPTRRAAGAASSRLASSSGHSSWSDSATAASR